MVDMTKLSMSIITRTVIVSESGGNFVIKYKFIVLFLI